MTDCPDCARKDALLKEASLETDELVLQIREALGCQDGEAIAWAIGRLRGDVKLKDAQIADLQKDRERLDKLVRLAKVVEHGGGRYLLLGSWRVDYEGLRAAIDSEPDR